MIVSESPMDKFNSRWGWLAVLFALSNFNIYEHKRIESLKAGEVLTWLSMSYEKNIIDNANG